MKKNLLAIIACVALCSCNTQFGLAYGVKLTGDGDGQFEVTFPQGSYAMDDKAAIALNVGDTIPFGGQTVTSKAYVIDNGNARQKEALRKANDAIAEQFNATAGSGTYDIYLNGFIQEIGTGLIFEVDRHFTNRQQPARVKGISDPFPYIK